MEAMMPRGFFENTQEIYAEIASYPVVPPEKIKQYWNAYTTTFRRLFDPSAFRLENFWWHVWGSDRLRNLSGPELARLFEEFSNGPTFVPLPSPADRYARFKAPGSGKRGTQAPDASESRPRHDGSGPGSGSAGSKKEPTPSSTRPPPPHPILKKSRGPSSSGPRPTARFASPPALNDEAVLDGGIISPASTAMAAAEMPPPPLPTSTKRTQGSPAAGVSPQSAASPSTTVTTAPKSPAPAPPVSEAEMPPPPVPPTRTARTSAINGRKIVVTTAASKRRPAVARRQSSHSSTGSDSGPRVAGFVTASKRSGSKRSTPTSPQLPGPGSLSSQASDSGPSEKTVGKRSTGRATSKQPPPQDGLVQANGSRKESAAAQQLYPPGPQRRSTWDVRDTVGSREVTGGQRGFAQRAPELPSQVPAQVPPPVAGFVHDDRSRHSGSATPTVRSRSTASEASRRAREPGLALVPLQATSSVATSTMTALGQLETVTSPPVVPEAKDAPSEARLGSQPSSSGLNQKFKPTPPNPGPPVPFGRSRSELALLLKRGKLDKGEGT